MESIRSFIDLFGGKFEVINLFLLLVSVLIITSFTSNNKVVKFFISFLASSLFVLELSSLYFEQRFIDYQYFIHFNTRDISAMLENFIFETILFLILFISTIFLFYFSKTIFNSIEKISLKTIPFLKNIVNPSGKRITKLAIIAISIVIMSFETGVIHTKYELLSIFNTNNISFKESLSNVGMDNYVSPDSLVVSKGKNIIIISLESIEKGFLSDNLADLTPNLRTLKNEWNYFDMQQNYGGGWTSGSLYTSLTGFPAFFGVHGNSIFQTTYHSNITSITHVLKKADYNITYLSHDANSSGIQEMLYGLQVRNIIDKKVLGEHSRDKDVFERAKIEIESNKSQNKPFALFISTIDTHFPDGIYDKRMEKYVKPQKSDLKFMVSAVDYMLGDFIDFLRKENILSNTVVYIFPDHLKMGNPKIFEGTGDRSLYIMTNAGNKQLSVINNNTLYQIDLPNIFLDGAGITHNAKFLTDYISGDKNKYIKENIITLTSLNNRGLLRTNSKPFTATLSKHYESYKKDTSRYIAHAGGSINNYIYTNSLEALNLSYQKGFRLFELDIIKTKDGKYVAAHDWNHWAEITNYTGPLPVTNKIFLKHKIYGLYTPMDMDSINKWFKNHKDAILITDKINEPIPFSRMFIDKKRLMMELFSIEAVNEGIRAQIRSAMPSQDVLYSLGRNKVNKLKKLGVKNIAISREEIAKNTDLLKDLKRNGIKTYVFYINFEDGIDEEYVVKYEMDNIFGIYADNWSFQD